MGLMKEPGLPSGPMQTVSSPLDDDGANDLPIVPTREPSYVVQIIDASSLGDDFGDAIKSEGIIEKQAMNDEKGVTE
jgi:hypothetical protein